MKLAYDTRSQGEPLLMINGFLSTMSLWDPLMIETLAQQHQLILFDNRGVGLSTDTKENNTTIPQTADDAAGLLKALGIKKANILPYSMGARNGQQFLINHPDLFNKAELAAADPGGTHGDPAALRRWWKSSKSGRPTLAKSSILTAIKNDALMLLCGRQ